MANPTTFTSAGFRVEIFENPNGMSIKIYQQGVDALTPSVLVSCIEFENYRQVQVSNFYLSQAMGTVTTSK